MVSIDFKSLQDVFILSSCSLGKQFKLVYLRKPQLVISFAVETEFKAGLFKMKFYRNISDLIKALWTHPSQTPEAHLLLLLRRNITQ